MAKVIKKKTPVELVQMFKDAGKESFDIPISKQSIYLMKTLEWDDDEWNAFKKWYLKYKITVGGGHILEYVQRLEED